MTFTLCLSDLYYCLPQGERDRLRERKRERKAIKGHRWVWDNTADYQRNRELFSYRHC